MRETTFIYALKDPRTNIIRYVGKANDPYVRYGHHLIKCRDKNTHKRNWINNLKNNNLKPILEILEEVPIDKWKEYEKMYIKKYLDEGCDLMNYTDGGDGATFANSTTFKKGDGAKKVVMMDKDGKYIKTFDMISDAEKEIGTKSTVSGILAKNQKTTKGFLFLLESEYVKMNNENIVKYVNYCKPKKLGPNKTSYLEVEIYQYDLKLNFIKKWKSLSEASKSLNISKPAICHCAKGRTKKSGGYIWTYKKIN